MYLWMKTYLLFALISMSVGLVSAQNWGGGLALGLNASQVDGDFAGGFNRAGISVGGFVNYQLNPRLQLQPEILYEQLGSGDEAGLIVRLDYISVPVLASFMLPVDLGDSRQEIQFYAGPVVGILLGSRDIDDQEVAGLSSVDLRGQAGIGYRFGDVSLTLRYAYSITPIAGRSSGIPLLQAGARGLFHNYVSFSLRLHLMD